MRNVLRRVGLVNVMKCAGCNCECRKYETVGTFIRFSDGARSFIYRIYCAGCYANAPTSVDVDLYGRAS